MSVKGEELKVSVRVYLYFREQENVGWLSCFLSVVPSSLPISLKYVTSLAMTEIIFLHHHLFLL